MGYTGLTGTTGISPQESAAGDRNAPAAPPSQPKGDVASSPGRQFGLRLLRLRPANDSPLVQKLKDEISRRFPTDAVGQARIMAAIIYLIKNKAGAETGSEADRGYLARKLEKVKNDAARMFYRASKGDGARKGDSALQVRVPYAKIYDCGSHESLLKAMREREDIDSFLPQLKTKKDRNAVVALLQDPGERMEAAIEAACQELEELAAIAAEKEDVELFHAGARAAMERGLKVALPKLESAELEAKVAEVMDSDDAAGRLPFEYIDAFRELLERDCILESVVASIFFYRNRPDGNPRDVKRLIVERVFEAFSAKTRTERRPEDAGKLEPAEQQALAALLEDARKAVPKTLSGVIVATVGQPDDVRLDELQLAEPLYLALLSELEQLYPLDKEEVRQRRAERMNNAAFPTEGKAWESLTVGDLHQLREALEQEEMRAAPPPDRPPLSLRPPERFPSI